MGTSGSAARLSPLNSVVFACIFQSEEKAGAAMLEFLNAVLRHVGEEPIAEILNMRSEYPLMGEGAEQKYGRLDVRVKAESGRLFDIEVQVEKDFMNERGFFYGGRMGNDEFKAGTPYDQIPEVRVINIVDFYVRADHSHMVEPVVLAYANAPGMLATDKFKMYHIQLPAFRKQHKTVESVRGDTFLTWLYLLDRGYQDEEEMKMLTEVSEGLRNFAARYHYAINDPNLIRHYRMIEDGKRDIATKLYVAEQRGLEQGLKQGREQGLEQGREQGLEQGLKQGREQGLEQGREQGLEQGLKQGLKQGNEQGWAGAQIAIARSMKENGFSASMIEKMTGLSAGKVHEL